MSIVINVPSNEIIQESTETSLEINRRHEEQVQILERIEASIAILIAYMRLITGSEISRSDIEK